MRHNQHYIPSQCSGYPPIGKTRHKTGELQHIHKAKQRPTAIHNDLRMRENDVCRLRRHRANRGIIDPQQESLAIAVVPFADADQLLPTQRVERMRDADKLRLSAGRVSMV
jgi:hypothetical protein